MDHRQNRDTEFGNQEVEMLETILDNQLPESFSVHYVW